MLCATDERGYTVLANSGLRGVPSYCPECGELVVLKAGTLVVAHFAHRPDSACHYGEGESVRHREMKARLGRLFQVYPEQYERALIRHHRADVVLYKERVVVECQASSISTEEWRARTRDYNRSSYAVLWVWDTARFSGGDGLGFLTEWVSHKEQRAQRWTPFGDSSRLDEFRVPAEIRECHRISRGWGIAVLDAAGVFAGCRLHPAEERVNAGGSKHQWQDYTPKTLCVPEFWPATLRLVPFRTADGLLLAAPLKGNSWWQKI